jgi:hypothetical protein
LQVFSRVERSGLPQQLIHERGLTVIDVRDDGDVAKFLSHSEAPRKPTIIEPYGGSRRSFSVLR